VLDGFGGILGGSLVITVARDSSLELVLIRLVGALLGGDSTSGGGEDTSGAGGSGGEGSVFDRVAGFGARAPACFEEETDRKDEVGVMIGDDAGAAASFPSSGSTLLVDELLEGHMTGCCLVTDSC
jgi:hypothetical protein